MAKIKSEIYIPHGPDQAGLGVINEEWEELFYILQGPKYGLKTSCMSQQPIIFPDLDN